MDEMHDFRKTHPQTLDVIARKEQCQMSHDTIISNHKDSGENPVNLLLKRIEELGTDYFLDGEDHPCVRIKDDPFQKEWRIRDQAGKPSERIRAWLRAEFRKTKLVGQQPSHLS